MPKYAARRDAVEPEVIAFAKNLGWRFWQLGKPCDWLGLRRGVWHAIEVKNQNQQGHADEYTPDQKKFMTEVAACGGRVLVWRTRDCVLRDSGARLSA
jgi:hypothetical protein